MAWLVWAGLGSLVWADWAGLGWAGLLCWNVRNVVAMRVILDSARGAIASVEMWTPGHHPRCSRPRARGT